MRSLASARTAKLAANARSITGVSPVLRLQAFPDAPTPELPPYKAYNLDRVHEVIDKLSHRMPAPGTLPYITETLKVPEDHYAHLVDPSATDPAGWPSSLPTDAQKAAFGPIKSDNAWVQAYLAAEKAPLVQPLDWSAQYKASVDREVVESVRLRTETLQATAVATMRRTYEEKAVRARAEARLAAVTLVYLSQNLKSVYTDYGRAMLILIKGVLHQSLSLSDVVDMYPRLRDQLHMYIETDNYFGVGIDTGMPESVKDSPHQITWDEVNELEAEKHNNRSWRPVRTIATEPDEVVQDDVPDIDPATWAPPHYYNSMM